MIVEIEATTIGTAREVVVAAEERHMVAVEEIETVVEVETEDDKVRFRANGQMLLMNIVTNRKCTNVPNQKKKTNQTSGKMCFALPFHLQ